MKSFSKLLLNHKHALLSTTEPEATFALLSTAQRSQNQVMNYAYLETLVTDLIKLGLEKRTNSTSIPQQSLEEFARMRSEADSSTSHENTRPASSLTSSLAIRMPNFTDNETNVGDSHFEFESERLKVKACVAYLVAQPSMRSCRWIGQHSTSVISSAFGAREVTDGDKRALISFLVSMGKRAASVDGLLSVVMATQAPLLSEEKLLRIMNDCAAEMPLSREAIARHFASLGQWQHALTGLTVGKLPASLSEADKSLVLMAMFISKTNARLSTSQQWQRMMTYASGSGDSNTSPSLLATTLLQSLSAHTMSALEMKTVLVACGCQAPVVRKFLGSRCSISTVMKSIQEQKPDTTQIAVDMIILLTFRFANATHRSQMLGSADYMAVSAALHRLCLTALKDPKRRIVLGAKVIMADLVSIVNGIINRIGKEEEIRPSSSNQPPEDMDEGCLHHYNLSSTECIRFAVRTLALLCDQGADFTCETSISPSMWLFMANLISSSGPQLTSPTHALPLSDIALLLKIGVKHRMLDIVARLMMEGSLAGANGADQSVQYNALLRPTYLYLSEESHKLNVPNLWMTLQSMLSPSTSTASISQRSATIKEAAPRTIELFLSKCDWIRHRAELFDLCDWLSKAEDDLPFAANLRTIIDELLHFTKRSSKSKKSLNVDPLTRLRATHPSLFYAIAPSALLILGGRSSECINTLTAYIHYDVYLLEHCLLSSRCHDWLFGHVDALAHSGMTSNARIAVIGHTILQEMLDVGSWSEGLRVHRLLCEWPLANKVAWQSTALVEELTQRYLKQTAVAELYAKVTLAVRRRPNSDWSGAVEAFKQATSSAERRQSVVHALRNGTNVDTLRSLTDSIIMAMRHCGTVGESEITAFETDIGINNTASGSITPVEQPPSPSPSPLPPPTITASTATHRPDPLPQFIAKRLPHSVLEKSFKALAAQSPQDALKVYSQVLREEGRPSLTTLAAAAKACAVQANDCWAQSLSLLKQAALSSKTRHPPPSMIATTLKTLISASRWTEAADLCQKINRNSKQHAHISPSLGENVGLSLGKVYAGNQADREDAVILMADITMKCLVLSQAWDLAVHHFYSLIVNGLTVSSTTSTGIVPHRHYVHPSQATIEAALEACSNASAMAQQVAKDVRFFAGALEDLVCVSTALIEHVMKVVEAQRQSHDAIRRGPIDEWDFDIVPHSPNTGKHVIEVNAHKELF